MHKMYERLLYIKAMNGKVTYLAVSEMECHRLKAPLTVYISEVHPGADSVRDNLAGFGYSRYLI